MKLWASLKEAVDKLGTQATQIRLVRSDISMIEEDLGTQQQLWNQAEREFDKEKARLGSQLQQLQVQAAAGAGLDDEVKGLRSQVASMAQVKLSAQQEFRDWAAQVAAEEKILLRKKQQVSSHLAEMNATASEDLEAARNQQEQLQAAAQSLASKAEGLQAQIDRGQQQLPRDEERAATTLQELRAQVASMRTSLQQMARALRPNAEVQRELRALQARLLEQTAVIIQAKQEQAELVVRCNNEQTTRREVVAAEQAKAAAASRETAQFCNNVRGQYAALQQMVRACDAQGAQSVGHL